MADPERKRLDLWIADMQKTCPACGTSFGCGVGDCSHGQESTVAPSCWCMDLPRTRELDPNSDCLCPDCLKAKLMTESKLSSLRICSFESRRADEMASLIRRRGGTPVIAPSMRELPLEENPEVFRFADRMLSGEVDWVVFMTGVGATALREIWETRHSAEDLLTALDRCTIMVRGPKPTAVLKKWRTRIDHAAPTPNTWLEMIRVIDAESDDVVSSHIVNGKTIAVQEYGRPNEEFYDALRRRGANVLPVPVYRWALPEDTSPLEAAVRSTINNEFDWLLFTSAKQIEHVLEIAERIGLKDEFLSAARRCQVASIGPTCSDALFEQGIPMRYEASPPKMGQLVKGVFEKSATP